jgi:hypothetical protein
MGIGSTPEVAKWEAMMDLKRFKLPAFLTVSRRAFEAGMARTIPPDTV